eukprot:TRINITY_DN6236_c0_g1_i1.p1 TRINITY_DN6236_c0_g1~~TRINITY_DN6236_c0_g1_i1.p1  ORF type:complete len:192 (+),score=33.20 TRINITY_DN6236_c0_g1_i1:34-576(+)
MRPLTEEETKAFFKKLSNYIGDNIRYLVERNDEPYCFRLHKDRVYYVPERIMLKATNINRKALISLGVCFGKFTQSKKFRVHITALDYLAQFAKFKVWVKPSAELSFLYGNNILKAGLGRITENTQLHQGVVVYSMSDVPLGFGVMARSTAECRGLGPEEIVCFHQADLGEYLREEGSLI